MARPVTHFECYWSDSHLGLLVSAAINVLKHYSAPNVEIDELVSFAWLRCLRRRKGDDLRGCYRFIYCTMVSYVRKEQEALANISSKKSFRVDPFVLRQTEEKMDCEYFLSCLPQKMREVLLKRYAGGTTRELGKIYKVSPECIRKWCEKSLNEIREYHSIGITNE